MNQKKRMKKRMGLTLIGTSDSDASTRSTATLSVPRPFSNIQRRVLSTLF